MDRPPLNRITAHAHRWLAEVVRPGDRVLDATAGNGHDTVFLAELVGRDGHVLAIDLQATAIDETRAHLTETGLVDRVELLQANHADAHEWLAGRPLRAAVFNLGYLPGGDHAITTRTESTLHALQVTLDHLEPGGRLVIVRYPGHEEGLRESEAVQEWASALGRPFVAARYDLLNRPNRPPGLTLVDHTGP